VTLFGPGFFADVAVVQRVVGLVLLAGLTSGLLGFGYRWYARERIPEGLAALAGLGVVAVGLSTWMALSQYLGGTTQGFTVAKAVENLTAFGLAGLVSVVSARAADQLAVDVFAITTARVFNGQVGTLVRTVGRVITVELPETVADIEGYDPVVPERKEAIAGLTLVFPRGLTVDELRDRVVARLKDDYGIGHVDVELTADGSVAFLAVGARAAGLGPTLAPGTAAVAVRADPPYSAGTGDTVQLWRQDESGVEWYTTAELRATAGDVVTLAVDATDAESIDPAGDYRLVTLPRRSAPERELASLLRAADETIGAATVTDGSPLVGSSVEAVSGTVVAVRSEGGTIEALPSRTRVLAVGDTVYVVARPETLRRLEATAVDLPDATAGASDEEISL